MQSSLPTTTACRIQLINHGGNGRKGTRNSRGIFVTVYIKVYWALTTWSKQKQKPLPCIIVSRDQPDQKDG